MTPSRSAKPKPSADAGKRSADPLWYRDAIFYEIRVATFMDGDDDGFGDFRGLASRLDYLKDLGVTTLWLLPFCPSPLRDDGYDISDYKSIRPECGTLDDFRHFLREAHRRGLRVVTELVINHTSDQHPWFQRARRSPPGSKWRDFYVWSDDPTRYSEARIIFQDFEPSNWSWDPIAKSYYWHRFFHHQPDLNFDSPEVRKAVRGFLDFWLGMGVDGLRLDAIPYLFERDGTNCENLPETHAFLKDLRRHVDGRYADRMLLAEANQWPEDAVAYFGDGDECHLSFHFPVMPRLFMALHMEDRFPIIDILNQTPPIPETCQWALFLRNHDELTLEMVTDEERDYMYRVYAHDAQARINLGIRRRLAPLLGKDRRRIELMNALLFSLPGTPVIYYGDEIGMGDNFYLGDRNGVRTPMQWSSDRNAGFSRANPQKLQLPVIVDPEYHFESVNVEAQQGNPHSLLNWMKRLIALRKRYRAFGRGTIEFLQPMNRKVLAFLREYEDERILVVCNLSRFVEYVELDLSEYKRCVAVELFGQRPFPPIGDLPYLLTLGPHSFYWFSIEEPVESDGAGRVRESEAPPELLVRGGVGQALRPAGRDALAAVLREILPGRRWFGGKGREIRSVEIEDAMRIPGASGDRGASSGVLVLARVRQTGGLDQIYVVPLAVAEGAKADRLRRDRPSGVLAEIVGPGPGTGSIGVLYDALEDPDACRGLFDLIHRRRRRRGENGSLVASTTGAYRRLLGEEPELAPSLLGKEQSNSSVRYGDRFVLKIFRRVSEGPNPDLEIGRFLTERTDFDHIAPVAGALEYRVARREPATVGILQGFVQSEGDAWSYLLDQVEPAFDKALALGLEPGEVPVPRESLLALTGTEPPPLVCELMGGTLEFVRLLGLRTAELHAALALSVEDPAFAPEAFTSLYQRGQYQSMRNLTARTLRLLRDSEDRLPEEARDEARRLLSREKDLLDRFSAILGSRLDARRIRCHGDYHLGQVLWTGNDFCIIDFEGEPARSLGERRIKRSPLRDVAGMLRSFDYAAHDVLSREHAAIRPEDAPRLLPWARYWCRWVSSAFLRPYLQHERARSLSPADPSEFDRLLRALLLEKAVYEIAYELENRPGWVRIPLRGVLTLLDEDA